jgi:hypothetical protein
MLQVIDNGSTDALSFDPAAPDARSIMLASAASLVSTVIDVEGKLADTAKAWGANVFTLAYPADDAKPVTLDALIGDSKVAASWGTLATTDAGKKAKSRMEVYFSNARLVAESFDSLSDDDKRDIRAGISSIHYRAGLIRKAASEAKKAARKEADRVEAEAAATAPAPTPTVVADTGPDFFALIAMARAMIDPATWTPAHVEAINALVEDADAATGMIEGESLAA